MAARTKKDGTGALTRAAADRIAARYGMRVAPDDVDPALWWIHEAANPCCGEAHAPMTRAALLDHLNDWPGARKPRRAR